MAIVPKAPVAKSLNVAKNGEGKRPGAGLKVPKYGLPQTTKPPERVRGQQKQPDARGSNGVVRVGGYAAGYDTDAMVGEGTLRTPMTHAPNLLDGNTKMPSVMIPPTGLPDAPNPGNMGEGGDDIPGGGTFQNVNYPATSKQGKNFKSGIKAAEIGAFSPGGGNNGPIHEMRNVADRAKKLVYGGQTGFTKTVGEADDAGPGTAFKGEDTAVLRAKSEDMPFRLQKSYEKKGPHGTSVDFKPLGLTGVKRPLTAA